MRIRPVNNELTGQSSQLLDDWKREDWPVNTVEWCADYYDPEFYGKPEASQKNPVCASGSERRVFRGGGCWSGARNSRSASRSGDDPGDRGNGVSFRPVRSSQ